MTKLAAVSLTLSLVANSTAFGQAVSDQEPTPTVPAATASVAPAPTRIAPGSRLFIEPTEFGMALAAALLKKNVPVVAVTDRDKADFFVQTTSRAEKEGTGERVTKILMFGGFAGKGKSFDASVTIANRDGGIVFAHNSRKGDFQSAAQNVAANLKKHIKGR